VSKVKTSLDHKRIRRLVWLVLTIFVLWGHSLQNVAGSVQYSLSLQPNTTVTAPPVILQNGTAGTSTIYTNNTSARVNVAAPVSTYDFVDNNVSDVDSSADRGTHSNFTAQKYGPDLINDTLTEENTGGTGGGTDYPIQNMNFTSDTSSWNFVIVSGTDFAGGWDNTGQTGGSAYIDVTTRNEAGQAYWNQSFVATVNSTLQSVSLNHRWKVEVWNVVDSGTLKVILVHPNGTSWEVWTQTLSGTTSWSSLVYTNLTDYFTANGTYSLRLDLVADLGNDAATQLKTYYDDSGIGLVYSGEEANYELDLEVQWTSVDFDEPNEELCIYGGTMGAENIKVDVWNGSGWENLFTDLNSGWNNVSVSSYLNSSTFTIRFKGGTETGDTTQDSWNIDATLLHVWTVETYDYVLKVVNQVADNWTVNLKLYNSSNIGRLSSLNISLHDGTSSNQIAVSSGSIVKSEGEPYALLGGAGSTVYMSMSNIQATTSGTSYIYVYLKILVPDTSTYSLYVITFEIT